MKHWFSFPPSLFKDDKVEATFEARTFQTSFTLRGSCCQLDTLRYFATHLLICLCDFSVSPKSKSPFFRDIFRLWGSLGRGLGLGLGHDNFDHFPTKEVNLLSRAITRLKIQPYRFQKFYTKPHREREKILTFLCFYIYYITFILYILSVLSKHPFSFMYLTAFDDF